MSAIASSAMPRRLPPGCVEDRDRHGNVRIYFRVKERPKIRLRGTPWTPEFIADTTQPKASVADHKKGNRGGHLAVAVRPVLRRMRGLPTAR